MAWMTASDAMSRAVSYCIDCMNKGVPCDRMPKPAMPSSQARSRAPDMRHGPAAHL